MEEAPYPLVDETTLQRLVRLKALLADAVTEAADRSAIGRHHAVIALDGVCESALSISLDWLGEKPQFEYPKKIAQVGRLLGERWNRAGQHGVTTLHTARNEAQHHGVTPDSEEVARWATEADRFIRSLVLATFHRPLQELHTADAVADEKLRELLRRAEQQLDAGDSASSFETSWEALEAARARWRNQRVHHGRSITPSPLTRAMDRLGDELRQGVSQLEEFVEISTFATDFGEYVWLVAQRRESFQRSPPTDEDARRALVFTLAWVLRWESFNARFPEERWAGWWDEQRAPTTGLDHPQPVVVDVLRPDIQTYGWRAVMFQLADVPREDDDVYGQRWDTHVYMAYDELVKRENFPLPRQTRIRFTPSGQLTVEFPRDASVEAVQISRAVKDLIAMTQQRYQTQIQERGEASRQAERLAEPYRARLEKLEHPYVRVEGVSAALGSGDPSRGPAEDRVGVRLSLAEGMEPLALENLIRQDLGRDGIRGFGDELWFLPDSLDPEEAVALLVEAVEKLHLQLEEKSSARAREQQLDEQLVEDLRKQVGRD